MLEGLDIFKFLFIDLYICPGPEPELDSMSIITRGGHYMRVSDVVTPWPRWPARPIIG